MAEKKKNKKIKKLPYILMAFLSVILGVLVEGLTLYELKSYEDEFLDIYGDEQDGYVRVTIDQIKRLKDDATEADIIDIVASIDTTRDRYWTLAGGQNILFVKSVTETSRYKNLTSESYFKLVLLQNFIDSLTEDAVRHSVIFIEGDRYVASGANFSWNGSTYTICLMTYDYAILDSNPLLEAKNTIIVSVTFLVAVFICIIMLVLLRLWSYRNEIYHREREKRILNGTIVSLQEKLLKYESYTAKYHTYYEKVIPVFLKNLYEKKIGPLRIVLCTPKDEKAGDEFLDRMILTMDASVIRFKLNDGRLLLMFAGSDEKTGEAVVKLLDSKEVSITSSVFWELDETDYITKYKEFTERGFTNADTETVQGIQTETVSQHESLHNHKRKTRRNPSSYLGILFHHRNKKR